MVVGTKQCGNNSQRVPYIVHTLDYDDADLTAYLNATASNWTAAAHSYDLHVGHALDEPSKNITKRGFGQVDFSKDVPMDFEHDFSIPSIRFPDPDLTLEFGCTDCRTTGKFVLSFHLSTRFLTT